MSSIAAVSFKTGQPAPADLDLGKCSELKKDNDRNRSEVIRRMEEQKATPKRKWRKKEETVLQMAKGKGMTFSTGVNDISNATQKLSACSNALAQSKAPELLSPGGTSEQINGLSKEIRHSCDDEFDEAKAKAGVLCDKSHVHPGGGYGGHAEPKIVNHITNQVGANFMRGGKMLFNIDWQGKHGPSRMPCPTCYAMLCHAAKECDIEIFICGKDEAFELSKEDCSDPDSYENLCMNVDGGPTPGIVN